MYQKFLTETDYNFCYHSINNLNGNTFVCKKTIKVYRMLGIPSERRYLLSHGILGRTRSKSPW